VFQPVFADGLELALEPAADDIDRHPAVGELIDGSQLLGRQRRLPRARQDRSDDLSLVVAASRAWLKATDSCWYSAP
jgi:hypothetical protein